MGAGISGKRKLKGVTRGRNLTLDRLRKEGEGIGVSPENKK